MAKQTGGKCIAHMQKSNIKKTKRHKKTTKNKDKKGLGLYQRTRWDQPRRRN